MDAAYFSIPYAVDLDPVKVFVIVKRNTVYH